MAWKSFLFFVVTVLVVCVIEGGSLKKREDVKSPTDGGAPPGPVAVAPSDQSNASTTTAPAPTSTPQTTGVKPAAAQDVNKTCTEGKNCSTGTVESPGMIQKIINNKQTLLRTFYVLLGVTAIVVVYFGVRAWSTRRRRNKSRKYGLITTPGSELEMEPLDRDMDDDDDMTVFELNGRPRKK